MVKVKDMLVLSGIFAVLVLAVVWMALGNKGGDLSSTGVIDEETGEVVAPWANTIVNYKLIVSNKFTGADVAMTAKVYDEKPADWGNPRGTFDEAQDYTVYTASSGEVTINKEVPATYYVVATASGYNTDFFEITIPNGIGRGDISDYQSNPDRKAIEMTTKGTTTDQDFVFTLVNDTSAEESDTVLLTIAESTEFRGWKVIVTDEEGFSLDTDGDGTYDEGITKFTVTVGQDTYTIFDPLRGVDEFDSNDEFSFLIEGLSVADKDRLTVSADIEAITGDYTGANDEVWGEGEGVLSYIKIYDASGSIFATVDVTA